MKVTSHFLRLQQKSITNPLLKAKLKNKHGLDVKFQAFLRIPKISEKAFSLTLTENTNFIIYKSHFLEKGVGR